MLSDRELVARVVAGDADAQALFVDRFSRFIWAMLMRHLRVGQSASEELFQDVFVHLWADDCRRLRNWRGEGDFVKYLAPIVRHLAFRRPADPAGETELEREPVDPDPDPQELAEVREQREALDRAVERLAERDRELYERRFESGARYREIASAMGITVDNVGVSLSRLQGRLTALVEEELARGVEKKPGEDGVRFSDPEPPGKQV